MVTWQSKMAEGDVSISQRRWLRKYWEWVRYDSDDLLSTSEWPLQMSFTLFSLTTSLLTPICFSRVTHKCVWTRHRLDSCCENSDFLFRAICVIIKNSFSQNNSSAPKAKISIQFYLIQSPIRSAVQSDPSHPIRVLLTANIKLVIKSNIISHTHFQQINAMIWHFLVFFDFWSNYRIQGHIQRPSFFS